jgi:uncharacterized protein (TIGR03067 family)
MFARAIVIGFVFAAASTTLSAADAIKDLELLQGLWGATTYVQSGQGAGEKVDSKESPIQWTFKGESISIGADVKATIAKGTFKLDSAKSPKRIDISFPPATGAREGQQMFAIYKVGNGTLTICYEPDGEVRPTEFASKADSKMILIDFKQLKK